jgi:GTPase Era involved in 16S rRNA processing
MKFIPIIGTISAGKSTFLRAFLGTDVLQVGSVTTTKFVCLIKNSTQTSFYHVIPKKEECLIFDKEGEEIKDEEEIKQKIEEINTDLSDKKGTLNDIFYMLEIPIKNIENAPLLENCYFMDIPGLNEKDANYLNDIFSLISLDEILFEIVVFDSTSIGSDNILDIFTELEKKIAYVNQIIFSF